MAKFWGRGETGSFMYDVLVSRCHVTIRCDGRIFTVAKVARLMGGGDGGFMCNVVSCFNLLLVSTCSTFETTIYRNERNYLVCP